jgi:AraC-like DNA-binding protein
MGMYEKRGYLNSDFRMFHLVDQDTKEFDFHYHDFNKIIIFIRGDVTYCIEGKNYVLQPYDIVFVNSGEIHKPIINSNLTYERIIIYISTNFINDYKEKNYDLSFCFKKAKDEKSNVLRIEALDKSKLYQVSCELEQSFYDDAFANELYRKILFLEFMIQLNRAVINNHVNYLETAMSNKKVIKIIEYINNHLTEDISVDSIAEVFYLNRYYLMHLFKTETGYTLGNYITNKRLILAKKLIQAGTPVTDACYNCGFKNYSTFLRAFKKVFNKMPKMSTTV